MTEPNGSADAGTARDRSRPSGIELLGRPTVQRAEVLRLWTEQAARVHGFAAVRHTIELSGVRAVRAACAGSEPTSESSSGRSVTSGQVHGVQEV
jgi:hypothetical protein